MFLESLGNFLQGKGWKSNSAEEEEKRRRAQAASKAPSRTLPVAKAGQSRKLTVAQMDTPADVLLPTKVRQTQTLRPVAPQTNSNDFSGVPEEDVAIVQRLRSEGKMQAADSYMKAARNHAAAQAADKGITPGLIGEEAAKATRTVLGTVGGVMFDWAGNIGSRVVETVDQAGTAAAREIDKVNPLINDEQRRANINRDSKKFQGYEDFRTNWGQITDKIAGYGLTDVKATDERAQRISSGQAKPEDLAIGALDSFGFGGVATVPLRAARAATQSTRAATVAATQTVEKNLGRALTPDEAAQIANGTPPPQVVQEAASIGNGITTPSYRAQAETTVTQVAQNAQAQAVAEAAEQSTRQTLGQQLSSMLSLPTGRAGEAGFARIPGPLGDVEPPKKALKAIEAEDAPDLNVVDNIEADIIRREIKQLDDLAVARENAGADPKSLDSIYARIDAKQGELARVLNPPAPTKAQAKAAAKNDEIIRAQHALEDVAIGKPVKAAKVVEPTPAAPVKVVEAPKPIVPAGAPVKAVKVPDAPAPKKLPVAADAKPVKPAKAAKAPVVQAEAKPVKAAKAPKAPKEVPANAALPTKSAQVKAAKQAAQNVEATRKAAREQAKLLKKVDKKVKQAEGVEAVKESAPKLASRVSKEFSEGSDLNRTMVGLGDKRPATSHIKQAVRSTQKVSKQSDDEVLNDALTKGLGLGPNAELADQITHATIAQIPRLGRMRKVAEEAGDVEATKRIVTAFDNVMKTITEASSEAGVTNSAVSYASKNAGPDLMHALAKNSFVAKKGGNMTDDESKALLKTYEDIYTSQKQIDLVNQNHEDLMKKLAKGEKVTDDEIAALKTAKKEQEDILENSLAEHERVAGEIFERNVKDPSSAIEDTSNGHFGAAYEGWRKAAMLSAPTGRIRDMVTTTLSTIDKITVDTVEAAFGKLINQNNNVRTSMKIDFKAVVDGFKEGAENVRQIASGARKGGIYVDQGPDSFTRKYKGAKSELAPAPRKSAKPVRYINAASAAPTELFRGYRANRVLQYADVEGRRLGYSGKQLKQFKELYSVNPPKAIDDAVEQDFLLPSSMHKNFVYSAVDWADTVLRSIPGKFKDPTARRVADWAVREVSLLTMAFRKYAAGSTHRFLTDQNVFHNMHGIASSLGAVPKKLGGKGFGNMSRQDAATHTSRLTVNTAKLGLATAVAAPFLVDEDANGDSFSPPYLKLGENYVPLQSFGPIIAAPLGSAWANRKAIEKLQESGNPAIAAAEWAFSMQKVMLQSTGMDSLVAGDSPLVRLGTGLMNGGSEESGINNLDRVGGRFLQDTTTQWVPAVSRDVNALIDGLTEFFGGNQYAPETRVENEEGKKNYTASGLLVTASAVPGVRQFMANINPSEKANPNMVTRLLGGNRESDASRDNKEDKVTEESIKANTLERAANRVSKFIGNEKIASVLDEETRYIYDQAASGDTKNLTKEDYEKVESAVKKAEEKFLYESDYDTYLVAAQARRDKAAEDPTTSEKDLEAIDWDMNVAKRLNEVKLPYEDYQMYAGSSKSGNDKGTKAGVSKDELKKMLDPEETSLYDPDTANRLLQIDKFMAEAGLSDHSSNLKTMKYEDIVTGGAAARKAAKGGSGSSPRVITDIGSLSKNGTTNANLKLQYRDLTKYDSPIPNLSQQTARTNFKKNITVKRGVSL